MKKQNLIIVFIVAVIINTGLFLVLPVTQVLFSRPPAKKQKENLIEREVQTLWNKTIQEEKVEEIQKVKNYRPSFKPVSSPTRGKQLNLELATGGSGASINAGGDGKGVGITSGTGTGAMTYEPGQTDTDANSLFGNTRPETPLKAEREGVSGYVEIILVVNEQGRAVEVEIYREDPAGYGFGQAAITFLQKARFKPATLQGVPVRQKVRQPFRFVPEEY